MSLDPTLGMLFGLLIIVAALSLARIGLRGGWLRQEKSVHLACPVFGGDVDCEMVQDVRTGQWKAVRSCSAFAEPTQVSCEQDCARLLNLGLPSPRPVRF